MKKFVLALAIASVLTAFATQKEFCRVTVAHQSKLLEGVNKISKATENPMLGMILIQQIVDTHSINFLGAGQSTDDITFYFFFDDELAKKNVGEALDELNFASVYPVKDPEPFLKSHPKLEIDKDGFYTFDTQGLPIKDDKPMFLKFSADKSLAVMATTKELTTKLLAMPREKKDGRDSAALATFRLNSDGIKFLTATLEHNKNDKDGNHKFVAGDLSGLQAAKEIFCSLLIDNRGIAIRGYVDGEKDSELAKIGLTTLDHAPISFARDNDLVVCDVAANTGTLNPAIAIDTLVSLLAKNKVKTDFIKKETKDGSNFFTFDFATLISYINGEGKEAFQKIDPAKFMDEFRAATNRDNNKIESPAVATSYAIKDYKPTFPVAKRFAKTMALDIPKDKKLFSASFLSIYSITKAVIPHFVNSADNEDKAQLNAMLTTLPADGEGAIATIQWRDGDKTVFVSRIAMDELKGISAIANAAMGLMMSGILQSGPLDIEEDDEDCDDCDCDEN